MSFSLNRPLAASSPSLCRRRLSFDMNVNSNSNEPIENEQHLRRETDQGSPSPILSPINYGGFRMVLEEELVEQLKQLVDNFLSMHIQQQHQPLTPPKVSTIRWTISNEHNLNYTVVITINQPSSSTTPPPHIYT